MYKFDRKTGKMRRYLGRGTKHKKRKRKYVRLCYNFARTVALDTHLIGDYQLARWMEYNFGVNALDANVLMYLAGYDLCRRNSADVVRRFVSVYMPKSNTSKSEFWKGVFAGVCTFHTGRMIKWMLSKMTWYVDNIYSLYLPENAFCFAIKCGNLELAVWLRNQIDAIGVVRKMEAKFLSSVISAIRLRKFQMAKYALDLMNKAEARRAMAYRKRRIKILSELLKSKSNIGLRWYLGYCKYGIGQNNCLSALVNTENIDGLSMIFEHIKRDMSDSIAVHQLFMACCNEMHVSKSATNFAIFKHNKWFNSLDNSDKLKQKHLFLKCQRNMLNRPECIRNYIRKCITTCLVIENRNKM